MNPKIENIRPLRRRSKGSAPEPVAEPRIQEATEPSSTATQAVASGSAEAPMAKEGRGGVERPAPARARARKASAPAAAKRRKPVVVPALRPIPASELRRTTLRVSPQTSQDLNTVLEGLWASDDYTLPTKQDFVCMALVWYHQRRQDPGFQLLQTPRAKYTSALSVAFPEGSRLESFFFDPMIFPKARKAERIDRVLHTFITEARGRLDFNALFAHKAHLFEVVESAE